MPTTPAHFSRRAHAWETYFTTTARLTERIESALKREARLSMAEYSVLLMTSRAADSGVRPSVLAKQVVFSRSRLTHTLKRLEARGLVRREACKGDGRGGLVLLTDEGSRVFQSAALVQRSVIRELFLDGISEEEIRVLTALFTRVAARLDGQPQ
ncbi:MarR family transcriptional regulator [Schaalia sp. HMT-877]|nr:MarR family transcriptional regulator [Schaalia sp. HMT-877]